MTNGAVQKLPKDWDRIDCSKQHTRPWLNVQIQASRYALTPGSRLNLYVRGAHDLCQDYCYKWRIVKGGGELSDLYGKKNTYTAPEENPGCENNPTIRLEYCGEIMDEVTLGVSDFISDDTAYYSAGNWQETFFPYDNA